MEWKNISCSSTHKKQYFVTKQKKRYCCSELYEHQCGILKKTTKTQIQMCTIYSYVLQLKFPTYRPTHI